MDISDIHCSPLFESLNVLPEDLFIMAKDITQGESHEYLLHLSRVAAEECVVVVVAAWPVARTVGGGHVYQWL